MHDELIWTGPLRWPFSRPRPRHRVYEAHLDEVRRTVPAERLLEFDVARRLGAAVPFPRSSCAAGRAVSAVQRPSRFRAHRRRASPHGGAAGPFQLWSRWLRSCVLAFVDRGQQQTTQAVRSRRRAVEACPSAPCRCGPVATTMSAVSASVRDRRLFIVLNAIVGQRRRRRLRRDHRARAARGRPQPRTSARRRSQAGSKTRPRRAVDDARTAGGVVVAAGGDGTLNAVARAVLGQGRALRRDPAGHVQLFRAQPRHSDRHRPQATRALLDAEIEPVPVGLVNGRPFLVNASLGLVSGGARRPRGAEAKARSQPPRRAVGDAADRPARSPADADSGSSATGARAELSTLTLFVGLNPLQLEQMGWDGAAVEEGKLAAHRAKPVSSARLLWLLVRGALGRLPQAHGVDSFAFSSPHGGARQCARCGPSRSPRTARRTICEPPLRFPLAAEPLLLLTPRTARAAGRTGRDDAAAGLRPAFRHRAAAGRRGAAATSRPQQRPDVLVLSGDITQRARRRQFEAARRFVDRVAAPVTLAIPATTTSRCSTCRRACWRPYGGYEPRVRARPGTLHESPGLLVRASTPRERDATRTARCRRRRSRASQQRLRSATPRSCASSWSISRCMAVRADDEKNLLHGRAEAVRAWVEPPAPTWSWAATSTGPTPVRCD